MNRVKRVAYNVPGIPMAPVFRPKHLLTFDVDYIKKKKRVMHKLHFLSDIELKRLKYPYHVILLHEMLMDGCFQAVQEINFLLWTGQALHQTEGSTGLVPKVKTPLVEDKLRFQLIADALCVSHKEGNQGSFEAPTQRRKDLGEMFLREGEMWLAEYFFRTAMDTVVKMEEGLERHKLEADLCCLIAFLKRETSNSLIEALEKSIQHMVVCRALAKGQAWQLKRNLISIRLKKPIALHGIRDEYEVVDGSSMSIYLIATLLEHEMLIGLASEILHVHGHNAPALEDLKTARLFADTALKLAEEVQHPVAMSTAIIRFGTVLRHSGAFADALGYFKELAHHAEITGDQETYCIAYHHIAMSQMGMYQPATALESLIRQKAVADMNKFEELSADALQEVAFLLLQEGQLWESEEAYAKACKAALVELSTGQYSGGLLSILLDEAFARAEKKNTPPQSHCDQNWAMCGLAGGQQIWSRFAALARSERYEDLESLMDWKDQRIGLIEVPRPYYDVENVDDVFPLLYNPKPYQTHVEDPHTVHIIKSVHSKGSQRKYRNVAFDSETKQTEEEDDAGEHLDDHEFGFASDYQLKMKAVHIARQVGGMRSTLSIALQSRGTLHLPLL